MRRIERPSAARVARPFAARVARPFAAVVSLCALLGGCSDDKLAFADGTYSDIDHWAGRWLVINYWAEWCAPCREEIPELNELHEDRIATGIVVVGVNYDGIRGADLADLVERMEIEFPVLADDPMLRFGYERAQRLPMTVLINPDREVAEILEGPQTRKRLELAVEIGRGEREAR